MHWRHPRRLCGRPPPRLLWWLHRWIFSGTSFRLIEWLLRWVTSWLWWRSFCWDSRWLVCRLPNRLLTRLTWRFFGRLDCWKSERLFRWLFCRASTRLFTRLSSRFFSWLTGWISNRLTSWLFRWYRTRWRGYTCGLPCRLPTRLISWCRRITTGLTTWSKICNILWITF